MKYRVTYTQGPSHGKPAGHPGNTREDARFWTRDQVIAFTTVLAARSDVWDIRQEERGATGWRQTNED